LLGPQQFRKGTDLYFSRFDGMAVTTEDFVQSMEEVSGINLGQFRRWYTQAGTPELTVSRDYDAKERRFTLTIQQQCPPTPRQSTKEPFFIPVTVALLDSKGQELALQLGASDSVAHSKVLRLTEAKQKFTFINIPEAPVPALLRGFSAPVKLQCDYTREELSFLLTHERDGFVRWEAGQQLALAVLNEGMQARTAGKPFTVDKLLINAFRSVLQAALTDAKADLAMLANLLLLPPEAYLAELAVPVDVEGIHAVREQVRGVLARELADLFGKVYHANVSAAPYRYEAAAIAQRTLKNTALNYLMLLEDPAWFAVARQQYDNANNMTDQSAALRALVNNPCAANKTLRDTLVAAFYQQWKHETLVVEQWLSLQSAAPVPGNLPAVEKLIGHEAFDLRNPNKVRSVIGAFCNANLIGFHAADGSGYRFLADYAIKLNASNPQIASRQLTPLTRWRKYDTGRQALMKAELRRLLAEPKLSPDVFEIVSKSLQD